MAVKKFFNDIERHYMSIIIDHSALTEEVVIEYKWKLNIILNMKEDYKSKICTKKLYDTMIKKTEVLKSNLRQSFHQDSILEILESRKEIDFHRFIALELEKTNKESNYGK